jgi:hypothetical protein
VDLVGLLVGMRPSNVRAKALRGFILRHGVQHREDREVDAVSEDVAGFAGGLDHDASRLAVAGSSCTG